MKYINYGDYIMPLMVGKQELDTNTNELNINLECYIGTCFFIGNNGLIATCGHVVDKIKNDEIILGKNLNDNQIGLIYDIMIHPEYDFAIGRFHKHKDHKILKFGSIVHGAGMNVRTFGFTNVGRKGKNLRIDPRLFKGNIVRFGRTPVVPKSRSTVELSFPSLKGFSGGPLLNEATDELLGMLFFNFESTIEVYSSSEIEESGQVRKESVHRIVELGLAHSIEDIIQFLHDLNI